MNRKVSYARLHQGAHIPSAGELGTVFPPTTKALNKLDMSVNDSGLVLSFIYNREQHEVFVPLANVVIMKLLPLEKKASKEE